MGLPSRIDLRTRPVSPREKASSARSSAPSNCSQCLQRKVSGGSMRMTELPLSVGATRTPSTLSR